MGHRSSRQLLLTSQADPSLCCWLTYRSSSNVCCTSRKASASRLLMSSLRYRAIKGIVFSSWNSRSKFAHTHGSTFVISDKACQRREAKHNQTHLRRMVDCFKQLLVQHRKPLPQHFMGQQKLLSTPRQDLRLLMHPATTPSISATHAATNVSRNF